MTPRAFLTIHATTLEAPRHDASGSHATTPRFHGNDIKIYFII
ncbi:hypothetical protein [Rickettsia endosymbiont of Orchestes rusci]